MAKQKEFEMTKVKSARTPAQKFGTGVLAVVINAVLWLFSVLHFPTGMDVLLFSEEEERVQC